MVRAAWLHLHVTFGSSRPARPQVDVRHWSGKLKMRRQLAPVHAFLLACLLQETPPASQKDFDELSRVVRCGEVALVVEIPLSKTRAAKPADPPQRLRLEGFLREQGLDFCYPTNEQWALPETFMAVKAFQHKVNLPFLRALPAAI